MHLVWVVLFSSKIVSFHQNSTTRAGSLSRAPGRTQFLNSKTKTLSRRRRSIIHTQFNAQLSRISMFHISFCSVKCVIAHSHARCSAAARNHNTTPP